MKKKYDVIIIGGGPSGSAAGITALKNGLSCCIIDKSNFPRKKLCGGLLTQKTIDLLKEISSDLNIDSLYNMKSDHVEMRFNKEEIVSFHTNIPLYFTYREDFDQHLHQHFINKGGDVYHHSISTQNFHIENNSITFGEQTLEYNYLIGADGANSVTRKLIDQNYKPDGLCMEVEIGYDLLKTREKNLTTVYFGVVPNGYAWIFPKQNGYTVGVGCPANSKTDIKKIFHHFMQVIGVDFGVAAVKGAFIPYGRHPSALATGNIMLVGDSAGLVDPVNGEGIYFALLSGKMAIESIVDVKLYKNVSAAYHEKSKSMIRIIREGTFMHKLLFNKYIGPLFFKIVKGHHRSGKYFVDKMVSHYTYSYRQMIKLIFDYKKGKLVNKKSGVA
ncbi:MAG: geranylgeranyl reductase family protein [Saprospiraceae bacterium]|nr:geranylgeranyl reductase family protein [Candidatus Vicinibacter affinis]